MSRVNLFGDGGVAAEQRIGLSIGEPPDGEVSLGDHGDPMERVSSLALGSITYTSTAQPGKDVSDAATLLIGGARKRPAP